MTPATLSLAEARAPDLLPVPLPAGDEAANLNPTGAFTAVMARTLGRQSNVAGEPLAADNAGESSPPLELSRSRKTTDGPTAGPVEGDVSATLLAMFALPNQPLPPLALRPVAGGVPEPAPAHSEPAGAVGLPAVAAELIRRPRSEVVKPTETSLQFRSTPGMALPVAPMPGGNVFSTATSGPVAGRLPLAEALPALRPPPANLPMALANADGDPVAPPALPSALELLGLEEKTPAVPAAAIVRPNPSAISEPILEKNSAPRTGVFTDRRAPEVRPRESGLPLGTKLSATSSGAAGELAVAISADVPAQTSASGSAENLAGTVRRAELAPALTVNSRLQSAKSLASKLARPDANPSANVLVSENSAAAPANTVPLDHSTPVAESRVINAPPAPTLRLSRTEPAPNRPKAVRPEGDLILSGGRPDDSTPQRWVESLLPERPEPLPEATASVSETSGPQRVAPRPTNPESLQSFSEPRPTLPIGGEIITVEPVSVSLNQVPAPRPESPTQPKRAEVPLGAPKREALAIVAEAAAPVSAPVASAPTTPANNSPESLTSLPSPRRTESERAPQEPELLPRVVASDVSRPSPAALPAAAAGRAPADESVREILRPVVAAIQGAATQRATVRATRSAVGLGSMREEQPGVAAAADRLLLSGSRWLPEPARTETPPVAPDLKVLRGANLFERTMAAREESTGTEAAAAKAHSERAPASGAEVAMPSGAKPAVLERELASEPVLPAVRFSTDGMAVAQEKLRMKASKEVKQIAGLNAQKMPATTGFDAPEQPVPAITATVREVAGRNALAATLQWTPEHVVDYVTRGTAVDGWTPTAHATAPVERVFHLISQEIVRVKDYDATSLAVVLKPDQHTEMFLHLTQHKGQVEAFVRFERGDFNALNAHWGQLQEALAQQNVRLAPLREPLPAAPVPTPARAGQSGASADERQSPRQNPAATELPEEMSLAGSTTEPLKRRTNRSGATSRAWESWA